MALTAFDTLAYARKLKDSGVSQDQAEAQAEALAIALKDGVADLATKRDVAQVDSNLKHEISESIAEARTEAKQDIAEVNSNIDSARAEAKQDIAEARAEARQDYTRLDGKLTAIYAVLGINTAILLGMFWMMFRYILVK